MADYYDRNGEPMGLMAWAKRFEDNDQKRVAADELGDCRVSTVWLGLDHSWGDGPPLIFETLVIDGPMDGEMDRYPTEEAALAGHAEMVERVRLALGETPERAHAVTDDPARDL